MKIQYKIIALSIMTGLGIWLVDSVLDSLIFHESTFQEALMAHMSAHEVYMRAVNMAILLVFGLLVSKMIVRNRELSEELRDSQDYLDSILKSTHDVVMVIDRDYTVTDVNSSFLEEHGFRREEIAGRRCYELTHKSDVPCSGAEHACPARAVFERGTISEVEHIHYDGDGQERIVEVRAIPIPGPDGSNRSVVVLSRDVTEHKRAEMLAGVQRDLAVKLSAVSRLDEGLHLCLDAAIDVSDMDCGAVYLHDEASGVMNLMGHKDLSWDFVKSLSRFEADSERARLIMEGRPVYMEYQDLTGAAGEIELRENLRAIAAVPILDEGQVIGFLGVASRDVSRVRSQSRLALETITAQVGSAIGRLRAEEAVREGEERERVRQVELFRISRLSTLGEMASGLAHELNQPLCAIQSCADLCLRSLDGEGGRAGKVVQNLQTIEGQAERAGNVIRRVKGFAKKQEPNRSSININTLVREALAFIDSDIRNNSITVDLKLPNEVSTVLADRVQIEQVLVNLVRNAVEAMAETEKGQRNLVIRTSRQSDDRVKVTVSDNGEGMTPEVHKHLFDPFFTTKADGLGIGLSISHSIIEAHEGELWAVSNPEGEGSSFVFTLPVSKPDV